ncbi:hypothetical protein PLESTF_000620700 [Pleodorina starrii]|nr:hypothetical protein PLESTM_001002400 [Pleodorina starrii]GLC67898.1 hypothetical protein PLESTF_000620700 [Pleodorina starrii]
MDPLSVLRDFNTSNRLNLVQQVEGNVQFGDRYSFPAATPVYKAAFAQAASAYYSLQDVLFYLKNRHLKPQEYVMAANQSGVANINIVDRKKVLDVLDGTAALDPSLVPSSAAAAAVVAATAPREAAAGAEPQAKRQRLAEVDEASAMKGLMEQERQLRNRNTMLLAPNKDFRRVLEVLLDVKKQVANRKHEVAAAAAAAGGAGSGKGGAGAAAAGRQQDPRAGAGGGSSRPSGRDASSGQPKGMTPGKAAPPPPPGGGGYVPVRKSGSSSAAAPPPPPPSSSSGAAKGAKGPHGAAGGSGSSKDGAAAGAKPGAAAAGARGSSGGGAGGGGGGKGDGSKKGGVPIIIVPSGLTSLINMFNARAFLEEGKYVPAAQAAAGGAPKPSTVTIRRTAHRPAPGVEYTVTDKPPAVGSADWDRVVAVVVQGAKWQFKDWPHKGAKEGDLAEAFAKVCGFYVHFADEKVVPPVSDWNVRTIPLHRESRHKDMTAMLQLYKNLDMFLQAKRSTLAY